MISHLYENIFDTYCEAIVNPVNCVGVMGAGLALQMKMEAPSNYRAYRQACANGLVVPGKLFVVPTEEISEPVKFIINFPTKVHWRDPSKIEYIVEGLKDLKRVVDAYNLHAVAIPALGVGCGGLPWKDVYRVMLTTLSSLGCSEDPDVIYVIYQPLTLNKGQI